MRRTRSLLLCCAVAVACSGTGATSTTVEADPDASAEIDAGSAGEDVIATPASDLGSVVGRDATGFVDLWTPVGRDATTPTTDRGPAPVVDATTPTDDRGPGPSADSGTPSPGPGARPTVGQMIRRVVHGRAYQNHGWTIDHETPEAVGRALASLRPTYVSGLLRIASDETLSAEQIRDFNTIRRLVRDSSPDCQFDVVLNAQQYETPAALLRKMEAINDAVHPDAWFFDFYYDAYINGYRNPLDRAVGWAHDHRQYIGGNTTRDDNVPHSDFAALSPVSHAGMMADGELDLKRDEIQRLHARGYPVLMHINNDPQFAPTTESCYFMGLSGIARYDWDYARRVRWITERVHDQSDWHFHFMYPVFFPECPLRHSYDALRDGMMMAVFVDLMRHFN